MLSLIRLTQLGAAALLLLSPLRVKGDCECGYSVNRTSDENHVVFTDVLESDFTTLKNITRDTDWVVQAWSVEKNASKGPYGRKTELKNAVSNPLKNTEPGQTLGLNGGPSGLELWVRSGIIGDEYVSIAEVDSRRTDMMYGTFRAGIQTTTINGTCAAFFWYLNDTQEIDMEFLTAQMTDEVAPVNLVLHSVLSRQNGGDAVNTPTYKIIPLPFQPSEGIHEYRFDWQPGSVSFYADGKWLVDMNDKDYVPSSPGKVLLSHWSNGNPLWTAGPPETDAKLLIQYVKAYFNSSDGSRKRDHAGRCANPGAPNAICQIPDQKGPPEYGKVQFFHTDPSGNKTNNQTIYAQKVSAGNSLLYGNWGATLAIALAVGGFTL